MYRYSLKSIFFKKRFPPNGVRGVITPIGGARGYFPGGAWGEIILPILFLVAISSGKILIPMDLKQTDHLKAYGIAYRALQRRINVEWLLNYRGGSFMMTRTDWAEKECRLKGVSYELISPSEEAEIRKTIANNNMEAILLEKAPKIAVYVPPHHEPWDDAVRLALEYAEIPYATLWDKEVLEGKLFHYDWLHLHHEDFTGQYGKFYASYRNEPWYKEEVRTNELMAKRLGFKKVSKLKLAVVKEIKRYIQGGGMVFAMCSSTDTPDIALAAEATDIVPKEFDGDGIDPNYSSKMNFENCLAFENFNLITDPYVYEHSDIDVYMEATARGPDVYFSLFDFSAKHDPVPCMLVQNHVSLVKEFLGQNCGFRRDKIKKKVLILGEVVGTEQVKYIHGNFGKGTFTFLGGHDPEDYAHRIGDPPTNLVLHKNSPGYRLILNNVLFPAAERKPLKTISPQAPPGKRPRTPPIGVTTPLAEKNASHLFPVTPLGGNLFLKTISPQAPNLAGGTFRPVTPTRTDSRGEERNEHSGTPVLNLKFGIRDSNSQYC